MFHKGNCCYQKNLQWYMDIHKNGVKLRQGGIGTKKENQGSDCLLFTSLPYFCCSCRYS